MNCKNCKADCAERGSDRDKNCRGYIPMTNADKIRSMTDEELAEWFGGTESFCPTGYSESYWCDACPEVCTGHWLDWLKVEAEEDRDG